MSNTKKIRRPLPQRDDPQALPPPQRQRALRPAPARSQIHGRPDTSVLTPLTKGSAVHGRGWDSARGLKLRGKPSIEDVRAALEAANLVARDAEDRISACCPLHEDSDPSLYIKIYDDDYSVTCHGCDISSSED